MRPVHSPRRRSVWQALSALVLTVTLMFATQPPATAAYSTLCSGYGACSSAGYSSSGYNDTTNRSSYWNAIAGHNCTNYVAFRLINNGASSAYAPGNAANWGSYFSARGVAVNNTPAVGAIAWWVDDPGTYTGSAGHVAYVERVNADGSIVVSEDNYGGNFHWKSHTAGYAWPNGFIHLRDVGGAGVSEGQFVSFEGHVYRIAGGAPVYVSSWNHVGGPQPTTAISSTQFSALRQRPADGTFVSDQDGSVYRFAGGAPIYVSNFDHVGGTGGQPVTRVDKVALENSAPSGRFSHVLHRPADGTFVSDQSGSVYRFAGGAPIYVSNFDHVGGTGGQPVTRVDKVALERTEPTGTWSHVSLRPADGTFVSDQSGSVYRFAGGAPIYVSNFDHVGGTGGQPVTRVDKVALERTVPTGTWSHVSLRPADGTFVSDQDGAVYRFAGGAPIYVSHWDNVGGTGGQPVTRVDRVALERTEPTGTWSHVRFRPADGTVLNAGGTKYVTSGGVPLSSSTSSAGTRIDPAAVVNAGKPGVWAHLAAPPPPPPPPPPVPATTAPSAPPPAAGPTPTPTTQLRSVVLAAVKKASRLRVQVGPASPAVDHRFVVQKRRNGKWRKVTASATRGTRDIRVLDLRRGVYRVVLPAEGTLPAIVTRSVRLRR